MPCSTNWVYWIVQDLVARIERGPVDEVLNNVSSGVYNRDLGFWPEVVDLETGVFVASGANGIFTVASVAPSTVEVREGTVDEVFTREATTSQEGLWDHVRQRGDKQYITYGGRDPYHTTPQPRVLYWEIACAENRSFAVLSAYTNSAADNHEQTCDATSDDLCAVAYSTQAVGGSLTRLLTASDENEFRMRLFDITAGFGNRRQRDESFSEICAGDFIGCFFPVVVDAATGLVIAHGAHGYERNLVGKSVLDPPYDVGSLDEFRIPAEHGGAFRLQDHTALGPAMNITETLDVYTANAFVVGITLFGQSYYVYTSYLHRMGEVRDGPYCTACSASENYPCGWHNAKALLGHIQTMLLGSPIDENRSFDDAWSQVTNNSNYAINTLGQKDFYAFAYDWNGTCVAHGLFPDFVGQSILVNAAFISEFVDVWDLHLQWVQASTTDAKYAVRYPWLDGNGECCFDKVVYVLQIARNGRNYFVAVGIGESSPAVPTFSEAANGYLSSDYRSYDADLLTQLVVGQAIFHFATSETNAMFLDAVGNVSAISVPSRDSLLEQGYTTIDLERWWDGTTNPYQVMVWAEIQNDDLEDQILVYSPEPAYVGKTLVELAGEMGTEQLDFLSLTPGEWAPNLVGVKKTLDADVENHFMYYDAIDIEDLIFDGKLDGAGARLHFAVFVRDRPGPPSESILGIDGCNGINAWVFPDNGVPGDQCECDPGAIQDFDFKDSTLSCLDNQGEAWRLYHTYEMECNNLTSCQAGRYRTPNNQCIDCPVGRARLAGPDSECPECDPGRFARKTNSVECTVCGVDEYQDEHGKDFCLKCPSNTARFMDPDRDIEPLGDSIDDCMCTQGTCLPEDEPCKLPYLIEQIYIDEGVPLPYNATEKINFPRPETGAYVTGFREVTGVACQECPTGGICLGGTNPPFPAAGYNGRKWGRIVGIGNEARYTGVGQEKLQKEWRNRVKFQSCDGENDGEAWCQGDFRCHPRKRRKGSLMCWAIAKKYFLFFGHEYKCTGGKAARYFWTILLFSFAIVIFLFLNVIMGSYPAMDIFLNNARQMSIIKDFQISWPLNNKYLFSLWYWWTMLDISQIDAAVVQPTCIAHESFEIQVVTQIALLALEFIYYFALAGYGIYRSKEKLSPEARQSLISRAISKSISATTMMYPTLCDAGFRGFICQKFDDQKNYLTADLKVTCWTSPEHARILFFCTLLTIFVFFFPIMLFLILRWYHSKNQLHTHVCLERYGLLYEGFKLECYQWGVFQIAKAFVLSCVQVLLEPRVTMQIFTAFMLMIFAVAAQYQYNPFLHRKSDYLEAFLLFATCAMLGMGSTFETLDAEDNNSRIESVIFAMLHLLLFSTVFVSLRSVYVDVRERRLTQEARARLLLLVNAARNADFKGAVDDDEGRRPKRYNPVEIHSTLKPASLFKWVNHLTVSQRVTQSVRSPAVAASSSSRSGVFGAFSSARRRQEMHRSNLSFRDPKDHQLLKDIGQVDEYFSPALSDVGIASVFSNTKEAVFWRRLDEAWPDLFEFLSTATTPDVVHLKVALGKLIAAHVHETRELPDRKRIGYRHLIAKEDRGALLRGLILADEGHRHQFFRILNALAEATGDEPVDVSKLKSTNHKIPLGYERNSGLKNSKTVLHAIRRTSKFQALTPRTTKGVRRSLSSFKDVTSTNFVFDSPKSTEPHVSWGSTPAFRQDDFRLPMALNSDGIDEDDLDETKISSSPLRPVLEHLTGFTSIDSDGDYEERAAALARILSHDIIDVDVVDIDDGDASV